MALQEQPVDQGIPASTSVPDLLKCGTELDRLYSILGENLRPRTELTFTHEQTTPQKFCQNLVEYIFSAFMIMNELIKNGDGKTTVAISQQFKETMQPTLNFVLDFNKKYGKLQSFNDCKIEFTRDLNTLGELFMTKRVDFENSLQDVSNRYGIKARPVI